MFIPLSISWPIILRSLDAGPDNNNYYCFKTKIIIKLSYHIELVVYFIKHKLYQDLNSDQNHLFLFRFSIYDLLIIIVIIIIIIIMYEHSDIY